MDQPTAELLVSEDGARALAVAAAQPDPTSLAAAAALRTHFPADLAAAALQQIALRRKGETKLGPLAQRLFLTDAGLQQATRPVLARWRAGLIAAAAPAAKVADLGCGLGIDALALLDAGLRIRPVELDPVTAVLASANLGVEVERADGADLTLTDELVYCDPARRAGARRSWRIEDLSPSWATVTALLDRAPGGCVKLGPGAPHDLLADDWQAHWVGIGNDAVELTVLTGRLADPGRRAVTLLAADGTAEEFRPTAAGPAPLSALQDRIHEPHPAVIAARAVDSLAAAHGWARLSPGIAYLTGEGEGRPWARSFQVREVLPLKEKLLRSWVRQHRIGTVEIKKRGVEVDPAELRRRLRPRGTGAATLILTPTAEGAVAVVVDRL
ncbi:class I SAM-dependent methyltransferase [Naumannella halotolerans]|uniref:THUMP-like domain-containing protein n=1 Tax=Naumannella halotolerans TaxID=993414 RepID=A0A4R7J9K9_9ACTN|nr:class I SAM-dependent methyltransferase [Naumannella halotolerans]TDT34221.1 hypothetical protein CLV29_1877 [Naumannella halotolerans]